MQAFHFVIASMKSGNVDVLMPVLLDLLCPILSMQVLLISSLQIFISIGFCLFYWKIQNCAHRSQLSRRDMLNSFDNLTTQSLFGRFIILITHLKYRSNAFFYNDVYQTGTVNLVLSTPLLVILARCAMAFLCQLSFPIN